MWCDADAYRNTNRDGFGHANGDRYSNCDRYGNANSCSSDANCDSDRHGHANGNSGWMSDGDHAIEQPDGDDWQLGLVQRRHTWVLPR
jgi:hypothetical protein